MKLHRPDSHFLTSEAALMVVSNGLALLLLLIIPQYIKTKTKPPEYDQRNASVTDQLVHQQPPDLPRLCAAQCCSWLYFAAEALVLLCGGQNNVERCCRLKCSGSSPQSKMPSC